ncbi:hypothetical protein OAT67_01430 [Bacteriovoracaceae bacterium]|nr:hypothetical protein [Bacteriovoracaceae bacterium]
MKVLLIISCLIAVFSCSKDENVMSSQQMWFKAIDFDPSIELVPIANHEAAKRVLCHHYQIQGCVEGSGKRIKVRLVEMPVIQFESAEKACEAAKIIKQWYAYNWLFDQVTNEPVLESFVKDAFNAKKATKDTICD